MASPHKHSNQFVHGQNCSGVDGCAPEVEKRLLPELGVVSVFTLLNIRFCALVFVDLITKSLVIGSGCCRISAVLKKFVICNPVTETPGTILFNPNKMGRLIKAINHSVYNMMLGFRLRAVINQVRTKIMDHCQEQFSNAIRIFLLISVSFPVTVDQLLQKIKFNGVNMFGFQKSINQSFHRIIKKSF